MILIFVTADKILKCDHSNESTEKYFPLVFITLFKVVLTFEPVDKILKCDHSNEMRPHSVRLNPTILWADACCSRWF